MFLVFGTCFGVLEGFLDSRIEVFGILGVFLDSGTCFGPREVFLDSGKYFGFWDVFWTLGRVLVLGSVF